MAKLIDALNERQREAVLYDDGGALILAGAGTGKTRVLTGKIIHLIAEQQLPPAKILAVTFTNKAANEMRARVAAALSLPPQGLMLGTFHSICHRLLRIHAAAAGLDKNFQILDSQDQLSFLRRLMREKGINEKVFSPNEVRHYISAAKERGFRAAAAPRTGERADQFARIYALYEEACRREHKVDFAELMLAVMELWRARDDLRAHYAARFRYVLIDELQDTSRQQFDWLAMLDSGDNRFFAVGDDDQSIYAFRGAEPSIMQEFQSRLRAGKLIRLEENYRSVKNILDAANGLIAGNKQRLGKTLITNAGSGVPIEVLPAGSDVIEAKMVAQLLSQHLQEGGDANSTAVLYRTNAQGRLFERELMQYGVPYRVYGGLRFYDRMEVKHALAYLRLLAGDDLDALLRVINVPPRGIGDKSIATLVQDGDPFTALAHSAQGKVAAFNALLRDLRRRSGSLADLVRAVLEDSGLLAHYEEKKEVERAENLQELVNAAVQFEQHYVAEEAEEVDVAGGAGAAEEGAGAAGANDVLLAFLSTAALESGGEGADESERAVSLMTVHAAKGLEFDRVFIVGMEEGLFPHGQSLESVNSRRALEEERRLLYVAITRARQRLSLHFAHERMLYGRTTINPSSRFLDELPGECLADEQWRNVPARTTVARERWRHRDDFDGGDNQRMQAAVESALPPPPPTRDHDGFRIGDKVRHKRYGEGIILQRSSRGSDEQVEVFFKQIRQKKQFKTALAPLEKV